MYLYIYKQISLVNFLINSIKLILKSYEKTYKCIHEPHIKMLYELLYVSYIIYN